METVMTLLAMIITGVILLVVAHLILDSDHDDWGYGG